MLYLNKFLVGADPEFVATDQHGHTVNAEDILKYDGTIGWDHQGRVMELRPSPAKGTYTLLRHIRDLVLHPMLENRPDLRFYAGNTAKGESLGGHIQFGYDPYRPDRTFTDEHKFRVGALDTLAQGLVRLDVLPTLARGMYGGLGDVRVDPLKGGGYRVEYRTLPSWLFSPKVAFLCLTAAKLAVIDGPRMPVIDGFRVLTEWVRKFSSTDLNARRLHGYLTASPKDFQVDPAADFRGRWRKFP